MLPNPGSREPVQDFDSALPRAIRKAPGQFAIHLKGLVAETLSASPNPDVPGIVEEKGRSSHLRVAPLEHQDNSTMLDELSAWGDFELPGINQSVTFIDIKDIRTLLVPPTEHMGIFLPDQARQAIYSIRHSVLADSNKAPTLSTVCAHAMASALTNTSLWTHKAPADGRSTKATFAMTTSMRRTTISVPVEINNSYRMLHETRLAKTESPPSLESLKTTGLIAGLSNFLDWIPMLHQD